MINVEMSQQRLNSDKRIKWIWKYIGTTWYTPNVLKIIKCGVDYSPSPKRNACVGTIDGSD